MTRIVFCGLILFILSACNSTPAITKSTPTSTPLPRVLVLTPEQYAIGGGTVLDSLIREAGGINAAAGLEDFRQISDSQIIGLAPDIVLFSQTWTEEQIRQWTQAEVYAELPAIQNKRWHLLTFSLAEADLRANAQMRIATLAALFVATPAD